MDGINFAAINSGHCRPHPEEEGCMTNKTNNYSPDRDTLENFNSDEKYSITGESEFTRESTIPFDQDEVLSERHYNIGPLESLGRPKIRSREHQDEPTTHSFKGKGPKGYQRSDKTIYEDICDALYRNTFVDATEMEVDVIDGVVTLNGFVTSREQKKAAEAAVELMAGVKDIFNDLRVRPVKKINQNPPFGLTNNITGLN
jgi:hypothetical protein